MKLAQHLDLWKTFFNNFTLLHIESCTYISFINYDKLFAISGKKRDQVSTNQQIEIKLGQGQSQKDLDPILKSYIRVKKHRLPQHLDVITLQYGTAFFFSVILFYIFWIDQDFILFCVRISNCKLSIFLYSQK